MERVDVYRGRETTDQDGNTVQASPALWASFQALVAPASQEQPGSTDSLPVQYDHTIYIRSDTETGIRETDLLDVRGRMSVVVGVVAVWLDRAGRHIGDVITVRRREG
ncbi:hypothetical protein [uncultured Bifidobacterium sp.]|uniref:hypothetical protein n=1 Tax=uncultured Bifidobacterium sp. TaxID=165187 RepID=UPI0025DAF585|nr:hypothetical protein [uncultured Bifidobacterium sp.]